MRNSFHKILFACLVLNLITGKGIAQEKQPNPSKTYAFVNGLWFDGDSFVPRTFYTSFGFLSSSKPFVIDSVIDLNGKFIVPPFGEAHNHNVAWSSDEKFEKLKNSYLRDGVYYVKNPNNLPSAVIQLAGKVNIPTSIDLVYANGGLTSSGGHPFELVKRNIQRKIWTVADGEGSFVYAIDSMADFDRKWPALKSTKPGFVKTYLVYSEEYDRRKNDSAYFGKRGLDPSLLKQIVSILHKEGFTVATHIETEKDLQNAIRASVDEINHMPGFQGNEEHQFPNPRIFEITDKDARLLKRKGIHLVTTLSGFRSFDEKSPYWTSRQAAEKLFIENLEMLKKNKVTIAIGSDSYRETSAPEASYVYELGVFSNLEMLKIWCENTAKAIFPKRKIGKLKSGYEANFLVLDGNPLDDFNKTKNIVLRIKSGQIVNVD